MFFIETPENNPKAATGLPKKIIGKSRRVWFGMWCYVYRDIYVTPHLRKSESFICRIHHVRVIL